MMIFFSQVSQHFSPSQNLLDSIVIPIFMKKSINLLYSFIKYNQYLFSWFRIVHFPFTQIDKLLNLFLNIGNKFQFHLVFEVKDTFLVLKLTLLFHLLFTITYYVILYYYLSCLSSYCLYIYIYISYYYLYCLLLGLQEAASGHRLVTSR